MVPRSLAVPTLLAASVAVPYVATNAPEWRQEWNATPPAAAAAEPTPPPAIGPEAVQRATSLTAPPSGPGSNLFPTQTPLEGVPGYPLSDVLRMDVTKEWVYQRWPRKSTALSELDLYGVRVPLVSGTRLQDLAGSLTYYFGADGRVQRISFRGRTGDTTELVQIATQRYGLQPQQTIAAGEQLFQLRRDDAVLSSLRTRPAPVLWASSPHDSFSVELELQNPATARPLPPEAPPFPPASAPAQASGASTEKKTAAEPEQAEEGEKSADPAWKAFFPRQRVPADQLPNLDQLNMYR